MRWSKYGATGGVYNGSRSILGEVVIDVSLVEVVTFDGIRVYGGWGMFVGGFDPPSFMWMLCVDFHWGWIFTSVRAIYIQIHG